MMTPNSNRKRRRSDAVHVTHDDDKANMRSYKQHKPPVKSSATKRFEKKVLKVIDEPKAKGKYTQHCTMLLFHQINNRYSIFTQDAGCTGNGGALTSGAADLEFFTARQFKDAEGVLFNGKTSTLNSWATTTEAAGGNFPAQIITSVHNSYAEFRFKNVSLHKSIVEMFICKGKSGAGAHPYTDWSGAIDAGQVFLAQGNLGGTYAASDAPTHPFIQLNPDMHPMNEMWDIQKIVFKFEPGEDAYHRMEGPKNYLLNAGKKLTGASVLGTPSFLSPAIKGCGTYVFFRIINDLTILVGATASSDINPVSSAAMAVGHPKNVITTLADPARVTKAGGIAVEIKRHYYLEAPEGVDVATMKNIYKICENFPVLASPVDQQIDNDVGIVNSGTDII